MEHEARIMSERTEYIPLEKLVVSTFNVRKRTDPQEIEKLAENIRSIGLQEPLVVRPEDGKYGVVIGSRRLEAIRLIRERWPRDYERLFPRGVPCFVRDLDPREAMLASLSENIMRQSISLEEVGAAIDKLRKMGLSDAEISARIQLGAVEVRRALAAWEAAKKVGIIPSGRPGRPSKKVGRRTATRKALIAAHLTARRLRRLGALGGDEEEEEFVRKFVEASSKRGLSSREIEREATEVVTLVGRGKKPYEALREALEKVEREDYVERVVALKRRIALEISSIASRTGRKFDDVVNELLEESLKKKKQEEQSSPGT